MNAPPCWFTAVLLVILLPASIHHGMYSTAMNLFAIMGWVLAEIIEREALGNDQ